MNARASQSASRSASGHSATISAQPARAAPGPSGPPLATPERALWLAGEHLRRAGLSHTRACALQAQGLEQQARSQSRMTEVLLSNAIHHLQRQAEPASSGPAGPRQRT